MSSLDIVNQYIDNRLCFLSRIEKRMRWLAVHSNMIGASDIGPDIIKVCYLDDTIDTACHISLVVHFLSIFC